jgi:hypothetical protein
VNNELKRIWKEATVAQFEALPQNLPLRAEDNYEIPQLGQPESWSRFEPVFSRVQVRIVPTFSVPVYH